MKTGIVYVSRYSGRQWIKGISGDLSTRGNFPGELWRKVGEYGVPVMREQDVDHQVSVGQMVESE